MKLGLSSLLLWSVLPAALGSASTSTTSTLKCWTYQGLTKTSPVPTSTVTSTTHITRTRTTRSTPTVTTTPPPFTKHTVVSTTTTVHVPAKGTATTTKINTSTQISTITDITTSIISTSTVQFTTTETYTVPTVAGFTPVASVGSVKNNGGAQKKRGLSAVRENARKAAPKSSRRDQVLENTNPQECPPRYPQKVQCNLNLEVIVYTTVPVAYYTKTTGAPRPPAVTSTKTVYFTKTVADLPPTSTVTVTSSVIISTTTEVTSTTAVVATSTKTSYGPVATRYAACQANNIISNIGGQKLNDATGNGKGNFFNGQEIEGTDGVECCEICQQNTEQCAGFLAADYGTGPLCFIFYPYDKVCDPSRAIWSFFGEQEYSSGFVGDGPCGYGDYDPTKNNGV